MLTVWKFPLNERTEVEAPGLGKTVLVGSQGDDRWVVWVEAHPGRARARRTFYVIGTGHPLDDPNASHVGSYVDGLFVWHVYATGLTS